MKKLISSVFCAALVLMLCVSALAAGTVSFQASASKTTLYRGDEVTFTVTVSATEEVNQYGVKLQYDSSVFEVVNGSCTAAGAMMPVFTADRGFAVVYSSATVPSGTVGTVTLRVKDNAPLGQTTFIGISSAQTSDASVNSSGFSKTLTITCDHTYGNWTETDENTHTRTCSKCATPESANHGWDAGSVTTPASCKAPGEKLHTCSDCGAFYTEDIPMTDVHTFSDLKAVDDEEHKDTCSVCKKEITEAHSYDSGKTETPATCKEEGTAVFTCSGCKHTKHAPIPKTEDHTYGNWQNVDEANHKHICSVCQKEEPAAHTWNKGTVTKKATCKETGTKTYTCTAVGCGAGKTEEIPLSETHSFSRWSKVDAENHTRTCSVCQLTETVPHEYKNYWSSDRSGHWHGCTGCGDAIDAAAHTPGKPATETTAQKCTVCTYVITPALGHTHAWAEEMTTDETGHWYACSGCEERKDQANHDFENDCDTLCSACNYERQTTHVFAETWTGDENGHHYACAVCGEKTEEDVHIPGDAATETTAQKCTVCGYEIVAALGHSFSQDWSIDEQNHYHVCACGEKDALGAHSWGQGEEKDEGTVYTCDTCGALKIEPKPLNVTWAYILIGVLSVAAVVVLILIVKKK